MALIADFITFAPRFQGFKCLEDEKMIILVCYVYMQMKTKYIFTLAFLLVMGLTVNAQSNHSISLTIEKGQSSTFSRRMPNGSEWLFEWSSWQFDFELRL